VFYTSQRNNWVGSIKNIEKTIEYTNIEEPDEVYIGTRYNTFESNKIIRFKPNRGNFDMYVDKNKLKRYVLTGQSIPIMVIETIINIYQSKERKYKEKQTSFQPNIPMVDTSNSEIGTSSRWVSSVCYEYQIYACKWMVGVEKNSMENQSYYRFKHTNSSYKRFNNFDTSLVFHIEGKKIVIGNNPVHDYHEMTTSGGVLADEVGLGKTLSMLLLCVEHSSKHPIYSRLDPLEFTYYPKSNTTLIITPSYLTEQWSSEIFKHTSPPLKHFIIGNKKDHGMLTYNDILTADIIIVSDRFIRSKHYKEECDKKTFITLQMSEHSPLNTTFPILHLIEWRRIILDEGDVVLPSIHRTLDMYRSVFRWYVSATPTVTPELIKYLNWNVPGNDVKPYLDSFSIRRTKDKVCLDLPRCEMKTIYVQMNFLEKDIYNRRGHTSLQRRKLCSTILHYKKYTHYFKTIDGFKDQLMKEHHESIKSIECAMKNNLEQITYLSTLLLESRSSSGVTDNMARASDEYICVLRNKQLIMGQELTDISHQMDFQKSRLSSFTSSPDPLDCSICYKEIDKTDMTMISCCHLFCNQCISQIDRCSICRVPFTSTRICNSTSYGSKIDSVLQYIKMIPDTEQILLYSQWTKTLRIMEQCLTENDIPSVLFSNDTSKIGKIMREFKQKKTRVLLLSIQTHNAGLDLYQANHVLFIDVLKGDISDVQKKEEQAYGRVHRIGQTETVRIVKFNMENTIEDTR
jgi:SNF2 family DNA or RNA helicase